MLSLAGRGENWSTTCHHASLTAIKHQEHQGRLLKRFVICEFLLEIDTEKTVYAFYILYSDSANILPEVVMCKKSSLFSMKSGENLHKLTPTEIC